MRVETVVQDGMVSLELSAETAEEREIMIQMHTEGRGAIKVETKLHDYGLRFGVRIRWARDIAAGGPERL